MARAVEAPAFLPLIVSGVVLAVAWHPAGILVALFGCVGAGLVLWRAYQEPDEHEEPTEASRRARSTDAEQATDNPRPPPDRICSTCGGDLWHHQDTVSHHADGPQPWEETWSKMVERGPATPENYIDAFLDLTWPRQAHEVQRLATALEHDLGMVPEDLSDRVYDKVRRELRAVGAFGHVLDRLETGASALDDGPGDLETLADELSQHVPDPDVKLPVDLARWLLEQESARREAPAWPQAGQEPRIVQPDAL